MRTRSIASTSSSIPRPGPAPETIATTGSSWNGAGEIAGGIGPVGGDHYLLGRELAELGEGRGRDG